jgi:transposase-like protein
MAGMTPGVDSGDPTPQAPVGKQKGKAAGNRSGNHEELLKDYKRPDLTGPGGIMEELHKRLYERVLEGELTHYLGYGKGQAPEQAEGQRRENYRNGSSPTPTRPHAHRVPS